LKFEPLIAIIKLVKIIGSSCLVANPSDSLQETAWDC